MKITEEAIPLIEKALGIKLYEPQKEYFVNDGTYWFGGRASGKMLAYCIKLALSEGKPLDMRPGKIINNVDPGYGMENNKSGYAHWFRYFFLDIWHLLKDAGFPVRRIIFEGTAKP